MALSSTIVCAARKCQNNGQALRAWLGRVCYEHRPKLKAECSCPPLYDFHKLPRDPGPRHMWLKALQLTEVPQNCYVCSVHFADKRPSDAHPYPELYLSEQKKPEKGTGSMPKPKTVTANQSKWPFIIVSTVCFVYCFPISPCETLAMQLEVSSIDCLHFLDDCQQCFDPCLREVGVTDVI